MNFNSWIFRGWNHRSQNQRAVASGNDNFVANSVQAIAAICTIFSGQKHTSKSILSLLQIQFWRMNHQRVSLSMILLTLDVCCNQVANTQTTYTYTLQNSGIALLSQINGRFVFLFSEQNLRLAHCDTPKTTGATVTYYVKAVNSVGESLTPRTSQMTERHWLICVLFGLTASWAWFWLKIICQSIDSHVFLRHCSIRVRGGCLSLV